MKERIFIDTNIVIDIIGNRAPFCVPAANLLNSAYAGEVELYATALIFANALYVLRRDLGTAEARAYLERLNQIIRIAPTTQKEVTRAFLSENPDFEDAIQYFSAMAVNADVIITRNQKHFNYSEIPVMDAEMYLISKMIQKKYSDYPDKH